MKNTSNFENKKNNSVYRFIEIIEKKINQIEKNLIIVNKEDKEYQKLKSYLFFLNEQKSLFQNEKKLKILFKDIFAMDTEKEELQDLISFFELNDDEEELFNLDSIKPKGYLLYGPPGTGKTFLIKAFSNECNAHFINLIPAKFDCQYTGQGIKALENIWTEAEKYDKCVIFIDEIDGMPNRENEKFTNSNITNTLLDKIDGFKQNNNKIIVMGASNNIDKLDKALRSRFSKEIYIDYLQNEQIEGFLKHVSLPYNISYQAFSYLERIAKRCQNENHTNAKYSNRDLADIIKSAYIKAAKYKKKNPSHNAMLASDLEEAMNLKENIKTNPRQLYEKRNECEQEFEQAKKL